MKKGRLLLLIGLVSLLFLGLAGCAFLEALFASIPDTPGTVTVTSNADGSLKITWSSVSDATSYQLLRDFTSDGEFADPAVYDDSSPSFTDTDVFAPFYYFYKVRATNSAGSSEFSDAVGGLTIGTYYWGSFGSDVLFATNDTAEYFTNELFTIDGINSNLTLESSLVASVSKAGGWYDGDIGIIFSFTDINNYWKFVIGPSGYYGIFRKSGGDWGQSLTTRCPRM